MGAGSAEAQPDKNPISAVTNMTVINFILWLPSSYQYSLAYDCRNGHAWLIVNRAVTAFQLISISPDNNVGGEPVKAPNPFQWGQNYWSVVGQN